MDRLVYPANSMIRVCFFRFPGASENRLFRGSLNPPRHHERTESLCFGHVRTLVLFSVCFRFFTADVGFIFLKPTCRRVPPLFTAATSGSNPRYWPSDDARRPRDDGVGPALPRRHHHSPRFSPPPRPGFQATVWYNYVITP